MVTDFYTHSTTIQELRMKDFFMHDRSMAFYNIGLVGIRIFN